MSRSRKKHPYSGITTARSDAPYKRERASKERAYLRQALAHLIPGEDDAGPTWAVPYNDWDAPKDGKAYWGPGSYWYDSREPWERLKVVRK